MKIKVKTNLIIKELNTLIKISNSKNAIPYLSGVYIKANSNNLTLLGTNTITSIKTTIKTDSNLIVERQGNVLVNCDYILSIIKKIEDEYVFIEEIENNILTIKTKDFYAELNCFDVDKFPKLSFELKGEEVVLKSKILLETIESINFSINLNEKRTILKGINFKKEANNLLLTTTDSFRLSFKKIIVNKSKTLFEKTLPYSFVDLIYKTINDNKVDIIKLYFYDNSVFFSLNNTIMQTKIILGKYPDAQKIIPNEFETKIKIKTNNLRKIIERVSSLSMRGYENNVLKLSVSEKSFIISSNVNQIAKSEEKIHNYQFNGKNQEIPINGKYLLDAVKSFSNYDEIEININNNLKPLIIKRPNNNETIQLILPIRTY